MANTRGFPCLLSSFRRNRFAAAAITAVLEQEVQHLSVLVHRPPQVAVAVVALHDDFVQVPLVTRTRLPAPESGGEGRAELGTPLPDRFVGDDDAAGQHQLFDVTENSG